MRSSMITAILILAFLTLSLAQKVNINSDDKNEKVNDAKDPQGRKEDEIPSKKHPALNPGFPYIWPYLQTPFYHPYYWPAYPYHGQYIPYIAKSEKLKNQAMMPYMDTLVFVGKFAGTCRGYPNGLYYIDSRSFSYCSNGIKTIQNCPEGAANPALSEFYKGLYRFAHDFCSVNLLVNKVPTHKEDFMQKYSVSALEEKKAEENNLL